MRTRVPVSVFEYFAPVRARWRLEGDFLICDVGEIRSEVRWSRDVYEAFCQAFEEAELEIKAELRVLAPYPVVLVDSGREWAASTPQRTLRFSSRRSICKLFAKMLELGFLKVVGESRACRIMVPSDGDAQEMLELLLESELPPNRRLVARQIQRMLSCKDPNGFRACLLALLLKRGGGWTA